MALLAKGRALPSIAMASGTGENVVSGGSAVKVSGCRIEKPDTGMDGHLQVGDIAFVESHGSMTGHALLGPVARFASGRSLLAVDAVAINPVFLVDEHAAGLLWNDIRLGLGSKVTVDAKSFPMARGAFGGSPGKGCLPVVLGEIESVVGRFELGDGVMALQALVASGAMASGIIVTLLESPFSASHCGGDGQEQNGHRGSSFHDGPPELWFGGKTVAQLEAASAAFSVELQRLYTP